MDIKFVLIMDIKFVLMIHDGDGNGCDGSHDGVLVIMTVILLVFMLGMMAVVEKQRRI